MSWNSSTSSWSSSRAHARARPRGVASRSRAPRSSEPKVATPRRRSRAATSTSSWCEHAASRAARRPRSKRTRCSTSGRSASARQRELGEIAAERRAASDLGAGPLAEQLGHAIEARNLGELPGERREPGGVARRRAGDAARGGAERLHARGHELRAALARQPPALDLEQRGERTLQHRDERPDALRLARGARQVVRAPRPRRAA